MKENVGRNDLCPCGSMKKYKKCCGRSSLSKYSAKVVTETKNGNLFASVVKNNVDNTQGFDMKNLNITSINKFQTEQHKKEND